MIVIVVVVVVITDVVVSGVCTDVVVDGNIAVVMIAVVSDFFGARMTNFKSRESVTAKIATMIKDIQIILTHR